MEEAKGLQGRKRRRLYFKREKFGELIWVYSSEERGKLQQSWAWLRARASSEAMQGPSSPRERLVVVTDMREEGNGGGLSRAAACRTGFQNKVRREKTWTPPAGLYCSGWEPTPKKKNLGWALREWTDMQSGLLPWRAAWVGGPGVGGDGKRLDSFRRLGRHLCLELPYQCHKRRYTACSVCASGEPTPPNQVRNTTYSTPSTRPGKEAEATTQWVLGLWRACRAAASDRPVKNSNPIQKLQVLRVSNRVTVVASVSTFAVFQFWSRPALGAGAHYTLYAENCCSCHCMASRHWSSHCSRS